jgi:sn-glycerol 3-phosphate transport system ATP-binding protein
VLMRAGRIEQDGTPVDLYEDPANTFVARFIGTPPMNLLRLERGTAGAVIAGTTGPRVASIEYAGSTLGVRPEHVVIGSGPGCVATQVEGVEYLGADSLLSCRVGSQTLTARIAGRVGLRRGDAAQLGWAPGALHIFDGATGARRNVDVGHETATMLA